jgi:hypothetical protein
MIPSHTLFAQFLIATAMLVACVVVHGFGLAALNRALRGEMTIERLQQIDALSPRGALFTLAIVLAIFSLHGMEIWAFAMLYMGIEAIPRLEEAIYFSTISYSTVGYSDVHIAPEWRLLGAFESILGMVLIGWSTAFFFRMLGRMEAH